MRTELIFKSGRYVIYIFKASPWLVPSSPERWWLFTLKSITVSLAAQPPLLVSSLLGLLKPSDMFCHGAKACAIECIPEPSLVTDPVGGPAGFKFLKVLGLDDYVFEFLFVHTPLPLRNKTLLVHTD